MDTATVMDKLHQLPLDDQNIAAIAMVVITTLGGIAFVIAMYKLDLEEAQEEQRKEVKEKDAGNRSQDG